LNGLIQPFQQPERVIGFFNAYREGQRVTRKLLGDIARKFFAILHRLDCCIYGTALAVPDYTFMLCFNGTNSKPDSLPHSVSASTRRLDLVGTKQTAI